MGEAAIVELTGLVFLKTLANAAETAASTHGPQLCLLDENTVLKVFVFSEEMLVLRLPQQPLPTSSIAK